MLEQIIRRTALHLMVEGFRRWRRDNEDLELIRLYFDLMYVYKFGFPKYEPPVVSPYEEPTPTPMIQWQQDNDLLLFELTNIVAGVPVPQPGLADLLQNRGLRLDVAQAAYQRYENALGVLEKEIATLQCEK